MHATCFAYLIPVDLIMLTYWWGAQSMKPLSL